MHHLIERHWYNSVKTAFFSLGLSTGFKGRGELCVNDRRRTFRYHLSLLLWLLLSSPSEYINPGNSVILYLGYEKIKKLPLFWKEPTFETTKIRKAVRRFVRTTDPKHKLPLYAYTHMHETRHNTHSHTTKPIVFGNNNDFILFFPMSSNNVCC